MSQPLAALKDAPRIAKLVALEAIGHSQSELTLGTGNPVLDELRVVGHERLVDTLCVAIPGVQETLERRRRRR